MQDKTIQTYIRITDEIKELEALKDQMRELISVKYKDGFTDETINIHFKEMQKWTYSQELKELEKSHKESIAKAKAMEEGSGVAVNTISKILTITIK